MTSVLTLVVISALAVLGLYFLWIMLGELVFGDSGRVVAVVPVLSADVPLEQMLGTLRASGIGSIIIVDYSGEIKTPEQVDPQGFRITVAAPERLREALGEIDDRR